jgi:hypothetical protein
MRDAAARLGELKLLANADLITVRFDTTVGEHVLPEFRARAVGCEGGSVKRLSFFRARTT